MGKFKPYRVGQLHLLPPSLEDYIPEGHLARVVYEVVEGLDTREIEDKYSEMGQHTYHPKILLKLLFYGYATGVRSGRKIAERCESDTAYMYLGEMYKPDFRTINDFRKNNIKEIERYFGEVVRICYEIGMIKVGSINIDGTKMRANAAARRSKDKAGYEKWEKEVERQIKEIMKEAEETEAKEDEEYGDRRGDELPEGLRKKEKLIEKIREVKKMLKDEKERKNFTDIDSKFMKDGQGQIRPGYNCQVAVTEGQVIVGVDVVNDANDRNQLLPMVRKAEEITGEEIKEVAADSGYSSYDNYEALEKSGIVGYIPDQYFALKDRGEYKKEMNRYDLENFRYDKERDVYWCPEGKQLCFYKERDTEGVIRRKQWIYRGISCKDCCMRNKCTTAVYRTVAREKREEYREQMRLRLSSKKGRQRYRKRMYTVEPVFGHFKKNLGYKDFLLRGLKKVRAEFTLMCIGYNLMKYWKQRVLMTT